MSNFLTSSIGKKVIMSLSGLFLISFLCSPPGAKFIVDF